MLGEANRRSSPPVSAPLSPASRGAIEHDEDGLLGDAGDVEQPGAALGRLLTDPGLRSRLDDAGRRAVEERCRFEHRMERIREFYDRLLQARSHWVVGRPSCAPD